MVGTFDHDVWSGGIDHLWQSTAFAGAVCLLLCLAPGLPARSRHALTTLASLKFLLPAPLLAALGLGLPAAGWLLPVLVARPSALGPPPSSPWPALLASLWAFGAGALLLAGWVRRAEHRRLLARGRVLAHGREARLLRRLERRLGLSRPVRLVESDELPVPVVSGVVRPVLGLPSGLARCLSDDELEAILLHELVHVERWDNLSGLLQRWITCLLWFHPLAWWLERRLLTERELACDQRVVAETGRPTVYARALLKAVRRAIGLPPGAAAGAAGLASAAAGELGARLDRILEPPAPVWPRGLERPLVVAAAAGLVLFTLLATSGPAPPADRPEAARSTPRWKPADPVSGCAGIDPTHAEHFARCA